MGAMVAPSPNKRRQDKSIAGVASFTSLCVSDKIEGGSSWVNFRARSRWSPVRAAISAGRLCCILPVRARMSSSMHAPTKPKPTRSSAKRRRSVFGPSRSSPTWQRRIRLRRWRRRLSEFGRVDILINNAAIRPHMPFRELTDEDWEHVRNVVLDGALYLTRALIGPMAENKYGNILFFVGDGAYSGRGSGRAHLSAAKMALVGLARGLASEFAPHNIRVNVVSPGSIDTRRDNPEWYGNRPPDADGIPLGRQGKIDEIAATCLFLVTGGGGFITGQTIHVNGGAGYY